MKITLLLVAVLISAPFLRGLLAKDGTAQGTTHRVHLLETEEVEVWKTTIHSKQPLKMHRHDNKRIVIALTPTELTVKNDKGVSHIVRWEKGSAHLLQADPPGELHVDINESDHPMEVIVIQFKKDNSH